MVVVTVTRQSGRRSAGSVEPGPGCPGRALRLHRDALPGARLPHLGGRRRGRAPGRLRHWQAPGTRVPSRGTGPEHRKLSSGVSTRRDCERRIPGSPRRLGFRHGDSDSESTALATCRRTMPVSGAALPWGRGFEFDPEGVASSASDRPGRDSDRRQPRSADASARPLPRPRRELILAIRPLTFASVRVADPSQSSQCCSLRGSHALNLLRSGPLVPSLRLGGDRGRDHWQVSRRESDSESHRQSGRLGACQCGRA